MNFFALVKCILGNEDVHFRSLKRWCHSQSFSFEKSFSFEVIFFLSILVYSEMSHGKRIIFCFLPNQDQTNLIILCVKNMTVVRRNQKIESN